MKKPLVPAMALALGVTASGFAANPFSDVPAGHWAYGSISKLAAAGVIEGYGDDTFRGERLMTRYEMAQIVAKALTKGANVEKLAAEFASELDALGVRVSALEKKSDNVQVTGELYYYYASSNKKVLWDKKKYEHGLRSRIYFNGKVNDNWNYVGRIENHQWFHDNAGNEGTEFNIAKLEGRLGGLNVVAGRDDDVFADGMIYDGKQDVIKVSYGDKFYVSGAYGKLIDLNEDEDISKKFWAAEAGTKLDSFVNAKAGYLNIDLDTTGEMFFNGNNKAGIFYAGVQFRLNDDLNLTGMYLKGNRDKLVGNQKVDDDGYVAGLSFKGAEASMPGSWGLEANYYHQGRSTYAVHTIDGITEFNTGFKGWSVGGDLAVAKNMVLDVTYYDTKALKSSLEGENKKARVLWSEFTITF